VTGTWWAFLATGIIAGIASGLFGIGGGLVIMPILVFALRMDQHAAVGTSLIALLLPVGIFAVWNFWQAGKITAEHLRGGLWIALGIAAGAYLGSHLAIAMNPVMLRRAFGVFLLVAAGRMLIS
jgi:uncharacterized membrane protein YfcA